MNIKETLSEIRKKYRLLADAECQQAFTDHYCNQFEDVKIVSKTSDSILIDSYFVNNIKIDQYNNLNCDISFMLPEYLRYFRLILNTHFEREEQPYYLRLGSHLFINYFRQYYKEIDDEYLAHMLSIDDHMPKEKCHSFREWLLGRNNDGRGELRYIKPPLLKNLVATKEGWTWHRSKDNCSVCKGEKGGVKGNENIIDGKAVCDYCSVGLSHPSPRAPLASTLRHLVSKMDVPAEHKDDLIWLAKNLAGNNKKHPDFPEAIHLIASLLKMTGNDIEIIGRT